MARVAFRGCMGGKGGEGFSLGGHRCACARVRARVASDCRWEGIGARPNVYVRARARCARARARALCAVCVCQCGGEGGCVGGCGWLDGIMTLEGAERGHDTHTCTQACMGYILYFIFYYIYIYYILYDIRPTWATSSGASVSDARTGVSNTHRMMATFFYFSDFFLLFPKT